MNFPVRDVYFVYFDYLLEFGQYSLLFRFSWKGQNKFFPLPESIPCRRSAPVPFLIVSTIGKSVPFYKRQHGLFYLPSRELVTFDRSYGFKKLVHTP
jgi:hypothetical protein